MKAIYILLSLTLYCHQANAQRVIGGQIDASSLNSDLVYGSAKYKRNFKAIEKKDKPNLKNPASVVSFLTVLEKVRP